MNMSKQPTNRKMKQVTALPVVAPSEEASEREVEVSSSQSSDPASQHADHDLPATLDNHTIRRTIANPEKASSTQILQLQQTYGNQTVMRLLKVGNQPTNTIQRLGTQNVGYRAGLADELFYRYQVRITPAQEGTLQGVGINTGTFAHYLQSGLRTDQILQLASRPSVNNANDFRQQADAVLAQQPSGTKDAMSFDWFRADKQWQTLKENWPVPYRSPGLFAEGDNMLQEMAASTFDNYQSGRDIPTAGENRGYALGKVGLNHLITAMQRLLAAIQLGAAGIVFGDQRRAQHDQLRGRLNKLATFHGTNPAANGWLNNPVNKANAQAMNSNSAKTRLGQTKLAIQQKLATIPALTRLAPGMADDYYQFFQTKDGELRAANNDTATVANATAVNGANLLTDADFNESEQFPNLNLSFAEINHNFWRGLSLLQKQRLNTKLAGFPVTGWQAVGYPNTRMNQNVTNNAANQILVPTLQNFPLTPSGEIVHDWIANTLGHGHTAATMNNYLQRALARQPIQAGQLGNLNSTMVAQQGGRVVYSWQNTAINIVINPNTNTLITYYNTQM